MSNQIFPNGGKLTSTALTPPAFMTIFQDVVAQILGFDTSNPAIALQAWQVVRLGWQQTGQPAFKISDNVCILTAYSENPLFSRVREQLMAENNDVSLNQQMSFTQVWRLHFTLYGPNSYDNARLIMSAMVLDWVHDELAFAKDEQGGVHQIYAVTDYNRPQDNYEVDAINTGQWWPRVDMEMRFNELVLENYVVPTVASSEIILITDTGITEDIAIQP